MNVALRDILDLLPSDLPAFVRIATAMMLMPGFGESTIPATARVGLSATVGIAVTASLSLPPFPAGLPTDRFMMTIVSEAVTGLWFGWLCRIIALALPIAGQYAGFMIGLSNVLQTDVGSSDQSQAIGAVFGIVSPVLILGTGLYKLQIQGLVTLFDIIPPGHWLPADDTLGVCVKAVSAIMLLALQLASPFVVLAVLWNIFIGQLARLGGRLQIYFISFPGQILLGLTVLMLSVGPMLSVWESHAAALLNYLPNLG